MIQYIVQSHHIGEIGRIGLNVARNVEEESLTEEEDVTNLIAQILIKGSASVMDTNRKSVMSIVVQV